MTWNWYLTIAATRQFMELAGLTGELEATNPAFVAAENALGELSLTARQADTPPTQSGAEIYRGWTNIRGRRERIECTVMPRERSEGSLPQLVRVRLKRS